VTPDTLGPLDGSFTVSATITHAGGPASDEVVQLYGSFTPAASVKLASVPRQQLLAFVRLPALAPGSTTPV